MNIKTILTTGILFFSTIAFAKQVDTKGSQVKWMGYGVGKFHWGLVQIKSADIKFDNAEPESAEIIIDVSSITVKDLKGKSADTLTNHLKSSDFFDVVKYPEAKFKTSSIKKQDNGSYKVDGKLTIKDETESATVILNPKVEGNKRILTGVLSFDRSEFNVKYNSPEFFNIANLGDKLVKDIVDLELKLVVSE